MTCESPEAKLMPTLQKWLPKLDLQPNQPLGGDVRGKPFLQLPRRAADGSLRNAPPPSRARAIRARRRRARAGERDTPRDEGAARSAARPPVPRTPAIRCRAR